MAAPMPSSRHTRRIGWSAVPHTDATFDAEASVRAGATFTTDVLTVPDTFGTATGGYIVLAIPATPGDPTTIFRQGNPTSVRGGWTAAGVVPDVQIDNEPHEVLVSNAELLLSSIGGATLTLGY